MSILVIVIFAALLALAFASFNFFSVKKWMKAQTRWERLHLRFEWALMLSSRMSIKYWLLWQRLFLLLYVY